MTLPDNFDAATRMGLPTTGVYHSFNGKIYFGGLPIIRVSRANFTISNNPDLYPEVGRREATPYVREFDVRGSFTRAYVNGAEWRLALGRKPSAIFDPGKEYKIGGDNELKDLLADVHDNSFTTVNTYPIKTELRCEINMIDGILQERGSGYGLIGIINGVMIDAATLTIGRGGDTIISGPINWIGEQVDFSLEVVTPGNASL